MKRLTLSFTVFALLLTASVLTSAKSKDPAKYKVVEVKHLTKADSVSLSADYLNLAYDDLREELTKQGVFVTVVGDGGTMSDADTADAVVLVCNITEFKSGGLMPPYIIVDVIVSSRADHTLIKQFNSGKLPLNNGGRVPPDDVKARNTGRFLAEVIKKNLQ